VSEFNNRIDALRQILSVVNRVRWRGEALHGLSSKALERWISRNAIDPCAPLVTLLRKGAAQLFFLANRSQEQVTEEYQERSQSLQALMPQIAAQVIVLARTENLA
jgi:hypothetical protein